MKKLLNRLFVPALASRPVSAIAERFFEFGTPIFMIHRMSIEGQPVPGITPDHLRQCLTYLVDHDYYLASLEELILAIRGETTLPEKSVVFTMDDGFADQAETAIPVFAEFNCPLTFFVITGLVDQAIWPWDAQISWIIDNTKEASLRLQLPDESLNLNIGNHTDRHMARETARNFIKEMNAELVSEIVAAVAHSAGVQIPDKPPPYYQAIDWDTARRLESNGIRFAPHSRTHRILSKLDADSASNEILGSWETLKRELNDPLRVFCYPTGRLFDFGPREKRILHDAGFLGAMSTIPGYAYPDNRSHEQLYALPRFSLPDSLSNFIQYCSWIEHANRDILNAR